MRAVIGIGIEEEDRKHTWMEDADSVCPIMAFLFSLNYSRGKGLTIGKVDLFFMKPKG